MLSGEIRPAVFQPRAILQDFALRRGGGIIGRVRSLANGGGVAGVTVASFESVGSILVVAMMIVPAAAAGLLTDRLRPMLVWSCKSFGA